MTRPPSGAPVTTDRLEQCPNCDAPLNDQFCAHCGQNNRLPRLDARAIADNAIEHLIELDAPIFRTVAGLTVRPGQLCRAYIEGKRRRYSNPIRYAFSMACLLLLMFVFFDLDPSKALVGQPGADAPAATAPSGTLRRDRVVQYVQTNASSKVRDYLNFVTLFTLPGVAGVLMLLFHSSRLTYGEHLAFTLFVWGHLFLVNVIVSGLRVHHDWWGILGLQVFESAYLTWAGVYFYRRGVLSVLWRMLLASIAYSICNAILGVALVFVWALYVAYFGDV